MGSSGPTANETTRRKARQHKNRGKRAAAGLALAATVERCFEDCPGDVKRALLDYRKGTAFTRKSKRKVERAAPVDEEER